MQPGVEKHLSPVNIALFSLIPTYYGLRYAMHAKQIRYVLRTGQLREENDSMAECIVLLRMVMVGIVVGVFALTIMVGKMVNAAWHHLHQRRENHV